MKWKKGSKHRELAQIDRMQIKSTRHAGGNQALLSSVNIWIWYLFPEIKALRKYDMIPFNESPEHIHERHFKKHIN